MTPLHLRKKTQHQERSLIATPVGEVPVVVNPDDASVVNGAIDSDGAAEPDETASTGVVSEPESPEPITVLVVGGGTSASVAVVRALSTKGHKVVAVDHDWRSPGLRLAPLGAVVPAVEDPAFEEAVLSVAKHAEARAVLAVEPEEMRVISKAQDLLSGLGTSVWTPDPIVFDLCANRPHLIRELTLSGLAPEKTGLGKTHEASTGRPSKRHRRFSVDVLADRGHDLVAAVSSWWLVENRDTTAVAETFFDSRLLDLSRAVCAAVRIEGPAVLEGYVPGDGGPALTSIRPGFSPLVPLALAAGVDVVELCLSATLGNKLPSRLIEHRTGVRMLQYLDQIFEDS